MYWFGSDRTGRRFADALGARARAGVRVLVTYDAFGSLGTDRSMFDDMRAAGCVVYEYNPLLYWSFSFRRFNRRNHRKILVVDNTVAFTGGVNLGDEWGPAAEGGKFRDDLVRIEGPAAEEMRAIFFSAFKGHGAKSAFYDAPKAPGACGSTAVRVLANKRFRHRRIIERAYIAEIQAARSRIWITNSYFIPRRIVRIALTSAVLRGVDVRVLLPTESDVPAVMYATHKLYGELMARGIKLFEWSQSILHSKTAVIDGHWCTVGSHNLDYRSWAYNLEINVMVQDQAVAAALERRTSQDLELSRRVDPTIWQFRSLGERVLEELFYRLRRLL
jgi:cardiolipin synthase